MESNALKLDGHVVRMQHNRWPKRIMMWSQEGRRRGRPEVQRGKGSCDEGKEAEELNI
jgi:hypothetical protein